MGKRFLTIILCMVAGYHVINAQIGVNVNIDRETLEQLIANAATQKLSDDLHNQQVDSIKQKQSKLLTLVTGIAAQKELIIQTYKNVSGFKQETKYYIMVAKTGGDIIKHSTQALEAIGQANLEGKAIVALKISGLVTQAISLGKAFSDIVADCEVPNPLKQSETGSKDKHNLLNRHERLSMANDILLRLRSIDYSLCYIIYLAKNTGWKELLFNLDRKTYITYIMTKVNTNDMINKWNRLQK